MKASTLTSSTIYILSTAAAGGGGGGGLIKTNKLASIEEIHCMHIF